MLPPQLAIPRDLSFQGLYAFTIVSFGASSLSTSLLAFPTKLTHMRLSLLGLGLLAPTASLGQVVVTVWVGTGDCSPTAGAGGSGAGGSDDRFSTEPFAYTSTGTKNSIHPLILASVASEPTTAVVTSTDSNGAFTTLTTISIYPTTSTIGVPQLGLATVETDITTTTDSLRSTAISVSPYVRITPDIKASRYTINPAYVASETTAVAVTSINSNSPVSTLTATSPVYPSISATRSPQPGPVTFGTNSTATINSLQSTAVATTTYVSTNSNGVLITLTTSTSTYLTTLSTTGSPQPGPATVVTNVTTKPNTERSNLSTGAANVSTGIPGGSLATSSTNASFFPTTTTSPATNTGLACSDDNTTYVDTFGLEYNIRCGSIFANADGASSPAHADTFVGCIQYCSLLENCDGVTYQGTNCTPIADFRGYDPEPAAEGTALLTAAPAGGPSSGAVTPDDLCAEGFDGQPYTDIFQCTWTVFCNQTIGGTPLQATIQTNLEACINYCAFYDGCESVSFEGDGGSVAVGGARPVANCYPMSSIGSVSQGGSSAAASLVGTCNVSRLVPRCCGCRCLFPPTVVREPVRSAQGVAWMDWDSAIILGILYVRIFRSFPYRHLCILEALLVSKA